MSHQAVATSGAAQALVVGGGPSGLSVAYALQGDTILLEKEEEVGGLCRSIEVRGGVFDVGGHSFHTPHPEVYELVAELMDGALHEQRRDARVYTHGVLIPYPFQRFYDRIPEPDVVRACEEGLQAAAPEEAGSADNFEDYIRMKFGDGIAEHFMLPYNRKLWARDIRRISCEWTAERVASPSAGAERFDRTGGQRKPLQPDTVVGYPLKGGYSAIYESFVPYLMRVETNADVVRIDPQAKTAWTRDGRSWRWEFLVSTMPLPRLVRIVEGTPPDLIDLADRLEYMSLRVELLLAGRRLETPVQRIYCAESEIPPHKIALNHNSSDYLRARPCHAIMAEVSISPEKPVDVEKILPATIDLLCDLGVLRSAEDIAWSGHVDVPFAYPVYTHDRLQLLRRIKDWMKRVDIYSVGRFGDWEYINSDRCVHKGLHLGRELREKYPDRSARKAATR